MLRFELLALMGLAAVSGQDHGDAPPSPLGDAEDGLQEHYFKLRDDYGFDVSEDAGQFSFEIDSPPLFLDLARADVGNAWHEFVSSEYHSQCMYGFTATKDWAGQCKGTMSKLRDALNKFSALYPPAGDRYSEDPYDLIQEDVAHQGYSRTGQFVDHIPRDGGMGYWNAYVLPWIYTALGIVGEYGDKKVLNTDVVWSDYVLLKGSITNEGTPIDSSTPFYPRFGSEAIQNKQFWGTNASNGAKTGFNGFENLGLLFRVQLNNAFGNDDVDWYEVMAYQDLTVKQYGSFTCELKFHDLRKIIRMMWRTMSDNPQIMPLNFFTNTIACPAGATGCVNKGGDFPNGKFPSLSAPAQILWGVEFEGKRLLQEIFRNSPESRNWLKGLGWPDAVVQLATSMALGGYYHLDYMTMDPSITEEMADAQMDKNDLTWDFIQRMGYIHDNLLDFTLLSGKGKSDAELEPVKIRINTLWAAFVRWCDANDMLDLLKYKLDPYFPVGNATAQQELTPTLPISNLPFMVINTHGKEVPCVTASDVDKCATLPSAQRSVNATLELYEHSTRDEPVLFNISIKGHGESSRQWPKKTFGIKFWNEAMTDTDDVPFLGMAKNDEWVLKGFYVDMTLNRDAIAYNLSREINMWAPHTRQTEIYLIMDDMEISFALHYKGVYTVTETISRGSHRVNIPKNGIAKDGKTPIPAGEGGYIFKVDKFNEDVDDYHTLPVTLNNVQIHYPGSKHLQSAQRDWAYNMLDNFETDLYSENFLKTGQPGAWDSWIDLESWANYFIHAEVMKSVDAYRFSTYFYTEGEGHTLKFGPPWDYDLSSGNTGWVVDLTGQVKQSHSWQYMWALTIATDRWTHEPQSIPQVQHTPCSADWFYRLLDVPEFKNKVTELWWAARHGALSDDNVRQTLMAQQRELKKGSNRNFAKWATLDRVDIWPHFPPPIEPTLDGKWMQLIDYMVGRVQWIDENIYHYLPHYSMGEGTTCDSGEPVPDCLNAFQDFPEPYRHCNNNPQEGMWWVRSNWQSNFKFFMNQTHGYNDGSDCSVLEYLHWEATEGGGTIDCPVPGGDDGILPPYPDITVRGSCNGESGGRAPDRPKCGSDVPEGQPEVECVCGWEDPLMTAACGGTIDWLKDNWKSNPKYAAGGVNGSLCSCQRFLIHDNPALACPQPRGVQSHLYCVENRCQKEDGPAFAPTMPWAPTNKPTPQTLPPTPAGGSPSPDVVSPTPGSAAESTCGASAPIHCGDGKKERSGDTPCAACGVEDCCRVTTCGVDGKDTYMGVYECADGTSAVNPATGCVVCDASECCSDQTCGDKGWTDNKMCASNKVLDPSTGCTACSEAECCEPDSANGGGSDANKQGSSAGIIIAVVLVVGALAAGGAFYLIRQKRAAGLNNFVNLNNDDFAEYVAPGEVVSSETA